MAEIVAGERGEEHLAVRRGGDAVGASAARRVEYRQSARFGIEPTIDAVLPGEPEHALAIKARGVEVGVAPFLGQGEELDCTGRGIDPGDRVLPTFGDPGGTVGRNDHAVGCRSRTQRDQIRFPGPGIEPAEFARGLRGEPDCAVRRGKDVVCSGACQHGKGLYRHSGVSHAVSRRHQHHSREHHAESDHENLLPPVNK